MDFYSLDVIVSIVIVSWNTKELLRSCLETIRDQQVDFSVGEIETIVVDNNSSDGSIEMIESNFPDIRILENTNNVGFTRGSNQGTRLACGEYILYLNPDTELSPGSLNILTEYLDSHTDSGAAGAKLLNPDGSLQTSVYPVPNLHREFWRLFHLDRLLPLAKYPLNRWDQREVHEVGVIQGACLILRRSALEDVGLLDEDYFMYTEDVDICHRLRQCGWGVYWVPRAEVLHHGGQSTRQQKTEMFLRLYESKILFFKKHYGRVPALVYKILLVLASIPRLFVRPLAKLARRDSYELHRETSHQYYKLLHALHRM